MASVYPGDDDLRGVDDGSAASAADLTALCGAARSGGEAELDALLRASRRLVLGALRALVLHEQDREDVMQEVFLKIARGHRRLRSPVAYSTWVWKIARRAALDANRRRRPEVTGVPLQERPDRRVVAPFLAAVLREESELLRERIARLPATYQRVMELAELEQRSPLEIADRLGLSEHATRSRLRRGRELLAERSRP